MVTERLCSLTARSSLLPWGLLGLTPVGDGNVLPSQFPLIPPLITITIITVIINTSECLLCASRKSRAEVDFNPDNTRGLEGGFPYHPHFTAAEEGC